MKKDKMSKIDRFMWAVAELRKAVDDNMYGNITFNLQEGFVLDRHQNEISRPVDNVKSKE